jgi:Ca2+-binding EF-hand superfamily protein
LAAAESGGQSTAWFPAAGRAGSLRDTAPLPKSSIWRFDLRENIINMEVKYEGFIMTKNNGLLSGIYTGLTNTYSYLASQAPDGLTLDKMKEISTDSTKANMINQTFSSYLQTNFATIDKNRDGKITEEEMTNLTNTMSKSGLSKDELTQLYASGASGLSEETMNMILTHFEDIDKNKDGKVTSEEIAAYSVESAKQEKMDEYAHQKATNMSLFYGSDSSSSVDSYSMLSYRYKK